jgi:TAP42-like family
VRHWLQMSLYIELVRYFKKSLEYSKFVDGYSTDLNSPFLDTGSLYPSSNESVEDIPNISIVYFILKFILIDSSYNELTASTNLRITQLIKIQDQLDSFLQDLRDFGLIPSEEDIYQEILPTDYNFRDIKIRRAGRSKEFKISVNRLFYYLFKNFDAGNSDEQVFEGENAELIRNASIESLQFFAIEALNKIRFVYQEIEILRERQNELEKENIEDQSISSNKKVEKPWVMKVPSVKSRKDVNIFGFDHSQPTVSLNEFADAEIARIVEMKAKEDFRRYVKDYEVGNIWHVNELEEKEEEVNLIQKRQWDEWCEENQKGSGNIKGNRG